MGDCIFFLHRLFRGHIPKEKSLPRFISVLYCSAFCSSKLHPRLFLSFRFFSQITSFRFNGIFLALWISDHRLFHQFSSPIYKQLFVLFMLTCRCLFYLVVIIQTSLVSKIIPFQGVSGPLCISSKHQLDAIRPYSSSLLSKAPNHTQICFYFGGVITDIDIDDLLFVVPLHVLSAAAVDGRRAEM